MIFCTCFEPEGSSYVYWTVHHLDSWIKIDQLDVTCFFISLFNAQHVSDVSTSILKSLRLICWVISWVVLLWYDVCWCYGVVWLRLCGIRMQAEALKSEESAGTDQKLWNVCSHALFLWPYAPNHHSPKMDAHFAPHR